MTTGTALAASIRNRLNLSADDARISDANLLEFINAGYLDVSTEHPWHWREATQSISVTVGDTTYDPPADWHTTLSLTIAGSAELAGRILQRRSWKWTRRLSDSTLRSVPAFYSEYDGVLHIYPASDASYTVDHRYLQKVSVLGALGNSVVSPDEFDRLIVTRASSYVAQKLRDTELYQMMETQYNKQMRNMKDDIAHSHEPVGIYTRNSWDYG